jgi:hypothetical protein
MPQVDKLNALLARIQKNAALLASQRAAGGQPSLLDATVDPDMLEDDLLVTIPPSVADSLPPESFADPGHTPSEPPQLDALGDFDSPHSADLPAEFRKSTPPMDEIEAPPISTQQERGDGAEDMDGLGVSLGFSRSGRPSDDGDDSDAEEEAISAVARTPPPESGPQISIPPKDAAPLETHTSAPPARAPNSKPTIEQLGSTIEFEDGQSGEDRLSRELELEEGAPSRPSPSDEFEEELPRAEFSGRYDSSLAPPPTAREELAAHDQAERERSERLSLAPSAARVTSEPPGALAAEGEPHEVISRPAVVVSSPAALYDAARRARVPSAFLDCLDASLALGPSGD